MNDVFKRIAALSPEQKALLALRLKQHQSEPTALFRSFQQPTQAIPQCDRSRPLAVSLAQHRTWFQDQLGVKSAVSNNISIALTIKGVLSVPVLEQSIQTIIQRHEILRTTLQISDGELTQIISSVAGWTLKVIDLRYFPSAEQSAEVQRLTTQQTCQPFGLQRDWPLRVQLLQVHDSEFVLVLTLHHIAVDAGSIGIFFRELSALYGAFSQNQPSPLAPLPIQYADFASWQQQRLRNNAYTQELQYWQQALQNAPDLLQLPSDRPRPPVQSFAGKTFSFSLSKNLTNSLKTLSQQTETTLFITLLAALQTLLFRHTGQEDILVGSPIANRQNPEIEALIGCFINTLVLRTNLAGNPTVRDLLRRVRETVLGALAHQAFPFERLVDELQLARNLAYPPLFQVMLVLQNAFSIETIELPGLAVDHDRIDNYTAQFDLTIHLVESDQGLIGKLEYNTDLFDEATIVRLVEHFQTLLASMIAHPDRPISQLPLLLAPEQQQIAAWTQTAIRPSQTSCIQELLSAQAQKTPKAIAVLHGTDQLTYEDLNHRANQLAQYLQKLGVQAGCRVGLWLDRSITMLVALFGILKAGAAYVPLDPKYPAQRLEFILSDAQVSVLLTQQSFAEKLPSVTAPVIFLDTAWETIALEPTDEDLAIVQAEALAYVIYTSGSTGQPKGVMVSHRSLINYTESAIQTYQITADDRILQFASISFDAAAEEIFPCLAQGATLILRTEHMLSSMAIFLQTCRDGELTVLDLPTAFWHQLVADMANLNLTLPESVRLVILGGEKASFDRFLLWQQRTANVRLVNSYGPTEATIVTTTMDLSELSEAALARRELPIGQPIQNARVYVLDADRQPVPIGIAGELFIGGLGVAQGYWNRPDLTAQVFIPDPFTSIPGARLYKTGDRVRWRADGHLEFLGRMDNQVKVRGFRIELGEIETWLSQHPGLQDCVVIDRPDTSGNSQLIAYVVPVADNHPTIRDLRQFLEKRLPNYMIPVAFTRLDRLPLTPNGKVDRSQLPDPDLEPAELTDKVVAPRTATEAAIAHAFAQTLQLAAVGIEDDFFELGGHSLLATKLMAQLLLRFPVNLSIVDLFESPTVAQLAGRIETLQRLAGELTRPALTPIARHPNQLIPLSFFQQSIWDLHHSGSDGAALNSSIILRIRDALDLSVVEQSLNEMVRRHEVLRTVFREMDNQPMQMVLPMLHLPLSRVNLQSLAPELRSAEALQQAIAIAHPPFDLATAPLIRTVCFQLQPQEHWLLITMHHIITDGWSFGVFLQELQTIMGAFAQGQPSPLAEVALQYADFALWQQQVYTEAAIAQELDHWYRKLVVLDPLVAPQTFPPAPPNSRRSRHHFVQLPEAWADDIETLSRTLGATRFGVVLAGLKLALARWTGQRDIWLFVTVGNRTMPQTEAMMGCFINDVIVRSQLLPEQSGTDFIQVLQANVQDAIDHKDIPITWVMERIQAVLPPVLIASVTYTSSALQDAQSPDWDVVNMQGQQRQWEGVAAELSSDETPLEIYIDMTNQLSIVVNYSVELFKSEDMDCFFAHYQGILARLLSDPAVSLSELLGS